MDEKDSTLLISYKEKQQSWFNFNISEVWAPLTLNVYLPEKQYESLKFPIIMAMFLLKN